MEWRRAGVATELVRGVPRGVRELGRDPVFVRVVLVFVRMVFPGEPVVGDLDHFEAGPRLELEAAVPLHHRLGVGQVSVSWIRAFPPAALAFLC